MTNRYPLITAFLFTGLSAAAQTLPNGGFENWASGVPTGWSTNNIGPLNLFPVTQSADAHSGTSAARGEVLPPPSGSEDPYPPVLQNLGAAISSNPGALTGWYKFDATTSVTQFAVSITLLDAGSGIVGIGVAVITDEASSYTEFTVPIDYGFGNGNPAASAVVSIGLGAEGENPGVGSWFLVDDLALTAGTGVEELDLGGIAMGLPFPQPVASTLSIPVELASAQVLTVEVLDTRGSRVAVLSDGMLSAGAHTLIWTPEPTLANGPYVVRLRGARGTTTRLVTVQR
jgi:hypothetical protein